MEKTHAWPWRRRGTIWCTYLKLVPSFLPYQWTPSYSHSALSISSSPPDSGTYTKCKPIVKCVRSGLISSLLPDEWLKTYGAHRHSQWDPASQPRDMCSHSIAGPHLPPAPFIKWICHIFETARLSATSVWAQWFWTLSVGMCQKWHNLNCMRTVSPCAIACFFVTGRQALKHTLTRDDWKC